MIIVYQVCYIKIFYVYVNKGVKVQIIKQGFKGKKILLKFNINV